MRRSGTSRACDAVWNILIHETNWIFNGGARKRRFSGRLSPASISPHASCRVVRASLRRTGAAHRGTPQPSIFQSSGSFSSTPRAGSCHTKSPTWWTAFNRFWSGESRSPFVPASSSSPPSDATWAPAFSLRIWISGRSRAAHPNHCRTCLNVFPRPDFALISATPGKWTRG